MTGRKASEAAVGGTDWNALRRMGDDDIERVAGEDEDNPSSDEGHWAQAVVGLPRGKTAVHASFDHDVVAYFKRGGRGYAGRMNAVLRRHMEAEQGDET